MIILNCLQPTAREPQRITSRATDNVMAGQSTSDSKSKPASGTNSKPAGGEPKSSQVTAASPTNYIKYGVIKGKDAVKAGTHQLDKLPQNQKYGALALGGLVAFWPLCILAMVSPWLICGAILAYSLLFGFETFVGHLEEVVTSEVPLSEKVRPRVLGRSDARGIEHPMRPGV